MRIRAGNQLSQDAKTLGFGASASLVETDGDVELSLGGSIPVSASLYSVVMDAQTVSDGAMGSGAAVLTSATGSFQPGDVGKLILVSGAAAAGADLVTTIASYQSATQVTLTAANASGGSIATKTVCWGTDNTTAINSAIAAVTPAIVGGRNTGGGTLQFATGSCMTQGPHTWPQNCEIAGWGEQATNIIHVGNNVAFTHAPTVFGDYNRPVLRDFTLWGSGVGSSAVGVQLGGKQQGASFERVVITNYSNGIGLLEWTKNAGDFVEGVTTYKLNLRFNLVNHELRRTSGNASFAYHRMIDYSNVTVANGIGLLIGDDANSSAQCQVYHGYWRGNIQIEGNNAIGVKIGSHGWVPGDTIWLMQGENPAAATGVKSLQINSGGVFYPHGFHDFGIDGFQVQPTMDVVNATTYRSPRRTGERNAGQGFMAESWNRALNTTHNTLATGSEYYQLVELNRGDVIGHIGLECNAVGSSVTLFKVGIYKSDLTLAASSTSFHASLALGPLSVPLTAEYTVPTDDIYYIGIVSVWSVTGPAFEGTAALGRSSNAFGSNAWPFAIATGLSDIASPATFASGSNPIWCAAMV